MKKLLAGLLITGGLALLGSPVHALTIFNGDLSGSQEVPAIASPATGLVTVILDDAEDSLTISATFANLLSPQTAAHIHGLAPPGANAPVRIFPPSLPLGQLVNFQVDIPETLPSTPALSRAEFVQGMRDGLTYFNIHTEMFPGGEIRGQLALADQAGAAPVPEPATLLLLGQGLAGVAVWGWRRGRRTTPAA